MHMRLAIDIGMGAFKYGLVHQGQVITGLIDTVLAPGRPAGFGERLPTITHQGISRIVGAEARASELARSCWGEGKVSTEVRLLALASLGQIGEYLRQETLHVRLASSLPVDMWGSHREALAGLLSGEHAFAFGNRSYRALVQLDPEQVLPEGYCAYLYLKSLGLVNPAETVGIVDVGQSTVGLCLIENERFVPERSTHRDLGMRVFYAMLEREIARLTGEAIDEVRIEQLYTGGCTELKRIGGENYQLAALYEAMRLDYGEKVFAEVRSRWRGVTVGRLVLVGGGARTVLKNFALGFSQKARLPVERVMEAALAHHPQSVLMVSPEARTANVRGLLGWLVEQPLLSAAG